MRIQGYITDNSSIDQAFRVERMEGKEYSIQHKAILNTRGKTLYYNRRPAECYYGASNGGRTYAYEEVWKGKTFPYLIAQKDPYDTKNKHGHGVGMSQCGAIEMARCGKTCEEILQFYLPGTTIIDKGSDSMTDKELIVQKWCNEQIGSGYVWGSTGFILTKARLDALIQQYPQYVSYEKNSKWIGKKVFDCQGLSRAAMKEINISIPSGASSQWKKTNWEARGPIEEIPRDKICLVFRESPSANPMQHVGVYIGDGYVVDARGSANGVVKNKLTDYKWTHYGIPVGIYTNSKKEEGSVEALYQAKENTGKKLNMREQPTTNAAVVLQVSGGATVNVLEEVDTIWWKIEYNGERGYAMNKYLTKLGNTKHYIKIPCESKESAETILAVLRNAEIIEA